MQIEILHCNLHYRSGYYKARASHFGTAFSFAASRPPQRCHALSFIYIHGTK